MANYAIPMGRKLIVVAGRAAMAKTSLKTAIHTWTPGTQGKIRTYENRNRCADATVERISNAAGPGGGVNCPRFGLRLKRFRWSNKK